MTPEDRAPQSEEDAAAKRAALAGLSSEERLRRARELAAAVRAQKAAERAAVAPASPATASAPTAAGDQPADAGSAPTAAAAAAPAARPAARREGRFAPVVAPEPGTIAETFAAVLPDVQITPSQGAHDVLLMISRDDALPVLQAARNDPRLAFDFLRNLSGMDYEDLGLEVVYHLYSYKHGHNVTIRARVPLEDPRIASAAGIWRAADWHEREARDMFGIVFDGHPDLVPLLLPEDMLDHYPLRKDNPLAPLEEWQGTMLGDQMGRAGYIPPGSGIEVTAEEGGE